jgi:hypothetical protein
MNKEKIIDINSIIPKGSIDEKLFKSAFIKYIKDNPDLYNDSDDIITHISLDEEDYSISVEDYVKMNNTSKC